MDALGLIDEWPVGHVAVAMIDQHGAIHSHGDVERTFDLASVTKLVTAAAVLVAHDEGTLDLDAPVDDLAGATGADLLAHSSGLGPDRAAPRTDPARRRIYSNLGYETAAQLVSRHAGFGFDEYVQEAVADPVAMRTWSLPGSPAAGGQASAADLVRFVRALREGTLLSPAATARMTGIHRPELAGVLPGFGRQQPNPWGQGPEIRGRKNPHWTGAANSPSTWGHFGQTGTFVWHDPGAAVSLVVLTDEPFGEWVRSRWPRLSDAVLYASA